MMLHSNGSNSSSSPKADQVKSVKLCQQSTRTWIGNCYGYTRIWAQWGDKLFEKDEMSDPNARNKNIITLKLYNKVSDAQWGQFYTDTDVSLRTYMLDYGLSALIDRMDATLQTGDTALINSRGLIGGHCMGLKKIEGGYKFFDCNKGEFEFAAIATFKAWFPEYLKKTYHGYFHMHTYEIFTLAPNESSVLKSLGNLFKNVTKAIIMLTVLPLGLGAACVAGGRIIGKLVDKFYVEKPSQTPPNIIGSIANHLSGLLDKKSDDGVEVFSPPEDLKQLLEEEERMPPTSEVAHEIPGRRGPGLKLE